MQGDTDGRHAGAESAPEETHEPRAAGVLRWLAFWVVFAALWLPLTFPNYLAIYLVGAVAAAVAATAANVTRARAELRFAPEARWLLSAWRLPAAVVRDTWVLAGALWRRLVRREAVSGTFRSARFPPGGDDRRGSARRAIAEAAASVAPNTVSLGIDRGEEVMLLHQLVPDDGPPSPADPLGLR